VRFRWPALILASALATPSLAQTDPEEQARRLLEDGRAYRRDGKLKQALDNFNTIITGFPGSQSVDDALLEVGRYYIEVEHDDAKGKAAFEQVTQRFPQSDGAPGAYYYLGWVSLLRAATPAQLDDALAQFTRVRRLYPKSSWVAAALHASGLVHRKAGRYSEAVDFQRRVSLEYPSSEVAPAAQFQVGHCLALAGEPLQAMEEFQQVRNRFPDSPWAAAALDRITILYRLYGSGQATFVWDQSFAVGSGNVLKGVRGLAMDQKRTLWIASDDVSAVVPFAPGGEAGRSIQAQDLRGLSLTQEGELIVATKRAVRIGLSDIKTFAAPDKPGELKELDDITAAIRTPERHLLVADKDTKRVHHYGADLSYLGTFPDSKDREVIRMILDDEAKVSLLEDDARGIEVYDLQGKRLRVVPLRGSGYEVEQAVDIAADAFSNLYIVDRKSGVYVFAPAGRLLAVVGRDELQRPTAIALEPSGALLVYDDKQRRVLRFQ
jgi:TolA-binding protein